MKKIILITAISGGFILNSCHKGDDCGPENELKISSASISYNGQTVNFNRAFLLSSSPYTIEFQDVKFDKEKDKEKDKDKKGTVVSTAKFIFDSRGEDLVAAAYAITEETPKEKEVSPEIRIDQLNAYKGQKGGSLTVSKENGYTRIRFSSTFFSSLNVPGEGDYFEGNFLFRK